MNDPGSGRRALPSSPPVEPVTTVVAARAALSDPGLAGERRSGWRAFCKILAVGALLTAFPFVPVAWVLRLWVLGWLLEDAARVATRGAVGRYPSWRSPWVFVKRGASYWLEVFPLLLPCGFMYYMGWVTGWIVSFEKVHDYKALGPVVVIGAMLVHAGCFVVLPMAATAAALRPRTRASWELGEAYERVLARPFRYFFVLALSGLLGTMLQVLRQPVLQKKGEFVLAGLFSFGVALLLKRMWARHFFLVEAVPPEARYRSRLLRGACLAAMLFVGFVHSFGLLASQFLMFGGGTEWFAHVLFLVPGAPAPLGGPQVYW